MIYYSNMSRNFSGGFLRVVKTIFDDRARQELTDNVIFCNTLGVSLILIGHGIYAYETEKKEEIHVVKKYKMNRNGFTEFMIIDDKGRHFNVNNSFWYWRWDSVEDWHRIDEKEKNRGKLFIKYYGWRIPALGLFPNIIDSYREYSYPTITNGEKSVC